MFPFLLSTDVSILSYEEVKQWIMGGLNLKRVEEKRIITINMFVEINTDSKNGVCKLTFSYLKYLNSMYQFCFYNLL